MLTENDVVNVLANYLEEKGYSILQNLNTGEQGVDIIAERTNKILYVEAKGETSSKSHTNRFGKPFTLNQISSHISRAILASMKVISCKPSGNKTKAAIALPDTAGHRKIIDKILPALQKLQITVFWVTKKAVKTQ